MGKQKRKPSKAEIVDAFDEDVKALGLYLRSDPIAFCKYALGFTPNVKQAELMKLPIWEQMHVMLPWGRQMGKSFIVSAFIAYCLFAFQDFRAFLFSPAEDQTKVILEQVIKFYQRSPILRQSRWKPADTRFSVGGDEWGSFVELVKIGHGGKLGRSRSTQGKGIIVFEEFNVLDMPEVVKGTLTPIMRSGGGEIVLSSPGDPGGEMHRLYRLWGETQKENPRYRVIECSIKDTTHLPPEFAEDCKREMPDWMYRRELLGEWVAPADTWFPWDDLKRCIIPRPNYNPKDQFVWAMDLGGRGRSAFVVAIARYNPSLQRLEVVELIQFYLENHKYYRDTTGAEVVEQSRGWERIEDILLDLRERYPPTWVGVDPATENSFTSRLANVYHFPISEILIGGYSKKLQCYTALQAGIRAQKVVWNHSAITDQLRSFAPKRKENGEYEFPKQNTDIVVCMVNLYQFLGEQNSLPLK